MSRQNKKARPAMEAGNVKTYMAPRTNPPEKAKGSPNARRKRAIAEMLNDLTNFLQRLPVFTFAFVTANGTHAIGPSLASTVDLAVAAMEGWNYEGPYPSSAFRSLAAEAKRRSPEIVAAVQERVQQLRTAGVSFILCWKAYGEKDAQVCCHGKYSKENVRAELLGLLAHEMDFLAY